MFLMKRKGISLPMNVIVVLILALIVLLALVFFFAGGTSGAFGSVTHQSAWENGCALAKNRGCKQADFGLYGGVPIVIEGYDPNGDKVTDDVLDACSYIINEDARYIPEKQFECWQRCCQGIA